jgi:hypothetical protein
LGWGLLCKQCLPSIMPGRYAVAPHASADRRLAFTSHLLRHVGAPIACVLHGWLHVSKSASAINTWARIHPRVREAGSAHQPLCTKQSCCEKPQSANRAACSDHNMSTLSIAVWEGRTAVDATLLPGVQGLGAPSQQQCSNSGDAVVAGVTDFELLQSPAEARSSPLRPTGATCGPSSNLETLSMRFLRDGMNGSCCFANHADRPQHRN